MAAEVNLWPFQTKGAKHEESLSHSVWECKYHVVWVPKRCRKIIYGKLRQEVGTILRKLCQYKGVALLEGKHNLVFPNEVGNPMDATNMIKRIWYPTLRRAGLPRHRFHLLMHTNASLRIEAGQNIKYIQSKLV